MMDQPLQKSKKKAAGKRFFWALLFVVLVGLTIWAITSQNKTFSWSKLLDYLKNANPFWLICAFAGMLGFIVFEALALRSLESFFGHKRSLRKNIVYTAADIYFSAITPSATGGQPASAMLMVRDGIPGATTAMCLLVNVTIYTVSIVLIGLFCLICFPSVFLAFSFPSRLLIIAGLCVQSIIVGFLILLIVKEKIVIAIADWGMRVLHKMHLLRNVETRRAKLLQIASDYRTCADAMKGHKWLVFKVLLFNLGQRVCNMSVTLFVCFAIGMDIKLFLQLLITQSFVVLGSNAVPIPGAVGVADGLFLDGFSALIKDTACIELLSRGISFYLCLFLCAALFFISVIRHSIRTRLHKNASAESETSS